MNKYTIYAAYKMVPNQYYVQDGTHKKYVKLFESELDCAKYCVEYKYKYESVWVEPDSEKVKQEHYSRSKAR